MIEAEAPALVVTRRPFIVEAARQRAGAVLESEHPGRLLCATGLVMLALSTTAAASPHRLPPERRS